MSSEAVKAKGGAEKNTINEDAIFRQLVKYENDWARNWPRKWGFMAAVCGKRVANRV